MERHGQIIVTYITTLFSFLGTSAMSSASLVFFDIIHEALGKAVIIGFYVALQVGTLIVALGFSVLLLVPDQFHLRFGIDNMIIIIFEVGVGNSRLRAGT